MNTPPLLQPSKSFLKPNMLLLKMLGVMMLALLLLIPLNMVDSVLAERLQRRNHAIAEITSTWGNEQTIVGPILIIPYRYFFKAWKEQTIHGKIEKIEVIDSAIANAYFLPSNLIIQGSIHPSKLHRGIYDAVVYNGKLKLSGQFSEPNFEILKIKAENVLWNDAVVTLAVPDLRGTRETLQLEWGASRFPFNPGTKLNGFKSGIHARIDNLKANDGNRPFELNLTLNGSDEIKFAPVGAQNTIKLSSPWPDPSFRGAFLPIERQITPNGFNAEWQASFYGRSYSQQGTDQDSSFGFNADSVNNSLFGVAFVSLVDSYRNVERSIKYGILFISLVFLVFFLFEILSSLKIHPFQYTLVGATLCLFYLGLLSLSEFISFPVSYLIASVASTLLISLYSLKILKSGRRTTIVTCGLLAIYAFLYIILQMQDYSLLLGTIALFVMLATVMYSTRNMNLYSRS